MNSSFAKSQLEKHGWIEGDGLGRKRDGMSAPIKVCLKMDKTGVGHDPGKEFTDHWWLRAFNDAAKKIKKKDEVDNYNSTKDESKESEECKRQSEMSEKKKRFYKGFVKGTTLTNGLETKESDPESEEDEIEETEKTSVPTLDDIHKFCGGATGHKAARFGIKMKGKLSRIAAHDHEFEEMSKAQPGISYVKKRKRNDGTSVQDASATSNIESDHQSSDSSDKKQRQIRKETENGKKSVATEDHEDMETKKKKKKRKKNKEDEEMIENDVGINEESIENGSKSNLDSEVSEGRRKKKKKKETDSGVNAENTSPIENGCNINSEVGADKQKKNKGKENDMDKGITSGVGVDGVEKGERHDPVQQLQTDKEKRKSKTEEEAPPGNEDINVDNPRKEKKKRKRKTKEVELSSEEIAITTVNDDANDLIDESRLSGATHGDVGNGEENLCNGDRSEGSRKKKKKKTKEANKESNIALSGESLDTSVTKDRSCGQHSTQVDNLQEVDISESPKDKSKKKKKKRHKDE